MDKPYGKIIVFTDRTIENTMLVQLFKICMMVGATGMLILLVVLIFLTRAILRPVQSAFEKQKQFISDASHELKTPLTVISASADVLEGEIGENKWLSHIRANTERMNTLVHDLLGLARLDQPSKGAVFTKFDLSRAVMSVALPFESTAFESGKTLSLDVEEGIFFTGDEGRVKQLVSILTDNAFKYSFDKGKVTISLKNHGGRKSAPRFPTRDKQSKKRNMKKSSSAFTAAMIQDRGTRADTGSGLPSRNPLADAHKGHISVESDEKETVFTVTL